MFTTEQFVPIYGACEHTELKCEWQNVVNCAEMVSKEMRMAGWTFSSKEIKDGQLRAENDWLDVVSP